MRTLVFGIIFLSPFFFSSCVMNMGMMGSGIVHPDQKDECGFSVNVHSGNSFHWNTSQFPVSFLIHESMPFEAEDNFRSAVKHWNLAWEDYLYNRGLEPFSLFYVSEGRYSGKPRGDRYNMVFYFHEDYAKYTDPRSQAITSLKVEYSGEITDTDIIINGKSFEYFFDDRYDRELLTQDFQEKKRALASTKPLGFWSSFKKQIQSWFQFFLKPFQKTLPLRQIASPSVRVPRNSVDFPSLMIHELGHVPGLAHVTGNHSRGLQPPSMERQASRSRGYPSSRVISVMEPRLANGQSRRKIEEYDLQNIVCGYFKL